MKIPVLVALASGILSCSAPMQLAELTFGSDGLQECELAAVPPDAELPCGAPGNPFVTSERAYLNCFGGMLLAPHQHHRHRGSEDGGEGSKSSATSELLAELEEFLFSVYHGGGEAGIFGLRFSESQAAQRAAALLRGRSGEHAKVHLKDNLVVRVWHDEGGAGCSSELDSLVMSRIR